MKQSILLITFACLLYCWSVAVTAVSIQADLSWEEFKEKFNKSYNSDQEELFRRELFSNKINEIKEFNSRNNESFSKGISQLSDFKYDEYMQLNRLKWVPEKKKYSPYLIRLLNKTSVIPDSMDWSKQANRVGPVKDQGRCGSCWAFAAIGVLESNEYLNSTSSLVEPLSEQNLIDCDKRQQGCDGGDVASTIEFIGKEKGVMRERDYPYKSINGSHKFNCDYKTYNAFVTTRDAKPETDWLGGNEEILKMLIYRYGPVAVGIDASLTSLQDYKSGVYYDKNCTGIPNHAVLLVGYGKDDKQGDYWLIKNSWSESWGESGYLRLARNRGNLCGVANIVTIVGGN